MSGSGPRSLLVVAALLTALVVQVSLLSRLGLPGAVPDLVLVVVLAFGMAGGPLTGTIVGFCGGLLVDLAPPSMSIAGQGALVFALAGYAAGYLAAGRGWPGLRPVLAVAGLAAGALAALAVIGQLLSSPEVTWSRLPLLIGTEALYAGLLAMLVLPLVGLLYRGAAEHGRA